MGPQHSAMNWWRKRFGPNGSFAEQAALVLQDFLLVLLLLCCIGIIHELIQLPFLLPVRTYIEPILTSAAVALVATFELEGVFMLIIAAIREIREAIGDMLRERILEKPNSTDSIPPSNAEPALKAFCAESEAKAALAQRESESGQFTFEISEVPRTVAMLGEFYKHFDAVSCCELPFWHTSGDHFAEEYFSQGVHLVRRGKTVTRLFIVSPEEFEQGSDLLLPVFMKQRKAGIGFAVVAYNELPLALREQGPALDFGLWDSGGAYSRFRQREGAWKRTMYVEFSKGGQNAGVAAKVGLYKELLSHVWLADECFIERHSATIEDVNHLLQRNNNHLQRRVSSKLKPEGTFYLEVKSDCDLRQPVNALIRLWKLCADAEQPVVDELQQPNRSAH